MRILKERSVIRISGADAATWLDGLVTSTLDQTAFNQGLVYTALLTPQGKYRADFLIARIDADNLLCDHHISLTDDLLLALKRYRLRLPIHIEQTDLAVIWDNHGYQDPRHPALGYRRYEAASSCLSAGDEVLGDHEFQACCYDYSIPQSIDFMAAIPFWLETDPISYHGINFSKGCYIGQEVTARMYHKANIRKKFVVLKDIDPEMSTQLVDIEGRHAGLVTSRLDKRAMAYIHIDRAVNGLWCDGRSVDMVSA